MRYYVLYSSYFDTHRYDTRQIANAIRAGGGTNVRTSYAYGWSNQPKVVTFTATSSQLKGVQRAVEKAVGTPYIIISKKDW